MIAGTLLTFLGLTFVNSKGCSQIVIDTNELHSGIDIPEVDLINCYFDEEKKIRVSVYKLKLNAFLLNEYTRKFKLVDRTPLQGITQLEMQEQPTTEKVIRSTRSQMGNKWTYVVEPETGMLWVEIVYN